MSQMSSFKDCQLPQMKSLKDWRLSSFKDSQQPHVYHPTRPSLPSMCLSSLNVYNSFKSPRQEQTNQQPCPCLWGGLRVTLFLYLLLSICLSCVCGQCHGGGACGDLGHRTRFGAHMQVLQRVPSLPGYF
mmetsp:Transcript_52826/g.77373  ORF Transcript_52826/g.77373 Transcript_52826/m.77373 type:complete len:130 (-) Transcript_52826:186-575(-)